MLGLFIILPFDDYCLPFNLSFFHTFTPIWWLRMVCQYVSVLMWQNIWSKIRWDAKQGMHRSMELKLFKRLTNWYLLLLLLLQVSVLFDSIAMYVTKFTFSCNGMSHCSHKATESALFMLQLINETIFFFSSSPSLSFFCEWENQKKRKKNLRSNFLMICWCTGFDFLF